MYDYYTIIGYIIGVYIYYMLQSMLLVLQRSCETLAQLCCEFFRCGRILPYRCRFKLGPRLNSFWQQGGQQIIAIVDIVTSGVSYFYTSYVFEFWSTFVAFKYHITGISVIAIVIEYYAYSAIVNFHINLARFAT